MQNINFNATIFFILYSIKKNIFIFLLLLLSILTLAILETSIIGSIDPIIKILQSKENFNDIYEKIFSQNKIITLEKFKIYFFILLGLILLLSGMINILSFYLANKLTIELNFEWKNKIINNYFHKNINFFNKNFTGNLIQKINVHTLNAASVVNYLAMILKEFIIILAIYILLLKISIIFTFSLTLFFIVIFISTNFFAKYYVLRKTQKRNLAQEKVFNYTNIIINGIKIIKLFNKQDYFKKKFIFFSNIQKEIDINTNTLVNYPGILVRSLTFISLVVLIFLTTNEYFFIENISSLVIYIASAYKINNSIGSINNSVLNISSIFPSVEIVRKEVYLPQKKERKIFHKSFKYYLKIKNIQFSHDLNNKKLFSNLNFTIKKNKFYIIYGASGSGKSTFADILVGFLKCKGQIKIDNYSYSNLSNFNNNIIAYSNQNSTLFPGTIVQNITLFENLIDRKRLSKIVGICKLNKLLKKDINGKLIFESGGNLSGGQYQRIALARTLYLDRQIILLDESISNVEKNLERQIMLNIKKYARENSKTVIVITHSNHYFDLADEIYDLNQGKLRIKMLNKNRINY